MEWDFIMLLRTPLNLKHELCVCLFKDFIYLFLERGELGGEREAWKHLWCVWEKQWSVASCTPPPGDLAGNPGMCPDWELNWWPFSWQAGTQSTEPHQPGHTWIVYFWNFTFNIFGSQLIACIWNCEKWNCGWRGTAIPLWPQRTTELCEGHANHLARFFLLLIKQSLALSE